MTEQRPIHFGGVQLPTIRQFAEVNHQNRQAKIRVTTYGRTGHGKTFTDNEARLAWYLLQYESHLQREEAQVHKLRKIAVTLAGAGRWILEDLLGGPGRSRHAR